MRWAKCSQRAARLSVRPSVGRQVDSAGLALGSLGGFRWSYRLVVPCVQTAGLLRLVARGGAVDEKPAASSASFGNPLVPSMLRQCLPSLGDGSGPARACSAGRLGLLQALSGRPNASGVCGNRSGEGAVSCRLSVHWCGCSPCADQQWWFTQFFGRAAPRTMASLIGSGSAWQCAS